MNQPLHVLMLETSPEEARLMLHDIGLAGFEPAGERVETEADFLAHLDPVPDIILVADFLPEMDALRALRLVKERALDIPVIVVTGSRAARPPWNA